MFVIRTAIVIAGAVLLLPGNAAAQVQRSEAVHHLTGTEYQKWVSAIGDHFRISQVCTFTDGNTPRFSAIATGDFERWLAKHAMTADDLKHWIDDMSRQGFRPTSVSGYTSAGKINYAATWLLNSDKRRWEIKFGINSQDYQRAFNEAQKKKMRPVFIAGQPNGDSHLLSAVFLDDRDIAGCNAFHDLTEKDYQANMDRLRQQGYYPSVVAGYASGRTTKFALVMIRDPRMEWVARHGLSPSEYQKEFDKHARNGLSLSTVSGYSKNGEPRYAGVWIKPRPMPAKLPMSGAEVTSLAPFDKTMQNFMQSRSIPSGTLTVFRNGKSVYSRGFGWLDVPRTTVTPPDAMFRLASVTKPLTASVIHHLVLTGKLKLSDCAFEILGLKSSVEPRFAKITIEQLLQHKGGWDRNKLNVNPFHKGQVFDPMFESVEIAEALKRKIPAQPRDVIDFMLTQPLQFDPGSKSVYSNFGYCVLGRVIEKVTGKQYVDYLQTTILKPIGANSIQLGKSLNKGRNPKEPFYSDSGIARNVFDPKGSSVPMADGGFHLEAMDSHGGLIGSAPDLCKFLAHYWIDGRPRGGGTYNYAFNGSLPGTWTYVVQLPSGVSYAVLFNQRRDASGLRYGEIKAELDAAVQSIQKWP